MKIIIYNQTSEKTTQINRLLKKIFRQIKTRERMQIILTNQQMIQEMNKQYRNIDKATDVLSFVNDDEMDSSLGDVFISVEQAKLQAEDYGHSFEREMGFLAVHGYLHLKGFDHHTDEEEKIMNIEQERILKQAKLERKQHEKH
jgi:probable rRNA maturation factor